MITSPKSAIAVSEFLEEYLRLRLGVSDLHFLKAPFSVTEGWETYIYRFTLASDDELPEEFRGPLVLRAYSSMSGLPRLQHEVAVQRHMHDLGYPVAQPLLVEESGTIFGGPFTIMEMLPGRTLLDELFRRFWRIAHAPVEMAEMQARLHRLPVDGFPTQKGEFLARQFNDIREMIEEFDLDGLRAGLDWLEEHRPVPPERPSIIHLDFHPINMLCRWRRCTGVLDWGDADVGDYHADVAASLVICRSAPNEIAKTFWQWLNTLPGRWIFWKYYLFAYRNRMPLDEQKLAYYEAWAALRRLCRRGVCLKSTNGMNGCKPSLRRFLALEKVDRLVEFFRRPSGIMVKA
jgi:aminoglycoside phosphotransferase (APT) family kinase protein